MDPVLGIERADAAKIPSSEPDIAAIQKAQQVLYEEGTKIRAQVLGNAHISASKSLPEFQQPTQAMAVASGWALCWSREGLDRKTRSLLCLVMLSVLGKDQELAVHTRGAINNGCTEDEIREALFQVSVYAGLPCALHATRVAFNALAELKENGQPNPIVQ